MTKYLLSLIMAIACSASFGQTTKPKLEQIKNDPKTIENAAKADPQLINKKKIADSSVIKPAAIKRKEQGRQSKRKRINLSGIKKSFPHGTGKI